jgi:hypothetical protein
VSVASAVLEQVRGELAAAEEYAAAAGLLLDASVMTEERPAFLITFKNRKGELFYVEILCVEYPKHPPTVEFLDSVSERRGTRDLYPSCFHQTPCVCARYNLKAYKQHGGPHDDWRLIDWKLPTAGGVAIKNLREILSDLHGKISDSEGRLG